MPFPRLAPLTAAAAAAALTVGCSTATEGPGAVRTWQPPATHAAGSTPSGAPATADAATPERLKGPLTAKDLGPGWAPAHEATLPHPDWATGCGTSSGVADLQRAARTKAVTGPGGVEVFTRVATYRQDAAADALGGVDAFIDECAVDVDGDLERTVMRQRTPAGMRAVGSIWSSYTDQGSAGPAAGYWIVDLDGSTVEVYVRADFAPGASTEPMVDFAADVRDAAVSKALGRDLSPVSVPPTGSSRSAGDRGEALDPNATDGSWPTAPRGHDEDFGFGVPEPADGVGGETGPGSVSGTGPADQMP